MFFLSSLFYCLHLLWDLNQVKKFGNDSQISLIAAEVGGTVEAASTEAQIELYDALIDGCREAIKEEILDPKVCSLL